MSKKTDTFVLEPKAVKLMEKYSISYPEYGVAKTAREAAAIADKIGYPVVMKIVSFDAPHKSDVGGVLTNLASAKEVQKGYDNIIESVKNALPNAVIEGVMVCSQAKKGVEVIVGATNDPVFGMTLMFGLGGIFTEVLKDVAFRSIPIKPIDAKEMIEEIKGLPMLTGTRGQASCDLDKLKELLLSVSRFIEDTPDITQLDLNPVRVYPDGVKALDVRIIRK